MLGGRRRFRFRNLGRLERLLGLMLLELNRTADERAYARIIRDSLASNGGSVRVAVQRWRALADARHWLISPGADRASRAAHRPREGARGAPQDHPAD